MIAQPSRMIALGGMDQQSVTYTCSFDFRVDLDLVIRISPVSSNINGGTQASLYPITSFISTSLTFCRHNTLKKIKLVSNTPSSPMHNYIFSWGRHSNNWIFEWFVKALRLPFFLCLINFSPNLTESSTLTEAGNIRPLTMLIRFPGGWPTWFRGSMQVTSFLMTCDCALLLMVW